MTSMLPLAAFEPISLREANQLLVAWEHDLGPVARPFHNEAYALELDGRPICIVVSSSTVSSTVRDDTTGRIYQRDEVVELSRHCSAPDARWASRIGIRLWREVAAPRWPCWPVSAGVSYSHAAHRGDLYRFDGWTCFGERTGSTGSGTWTAPRRPDEARASRKKLWGWHYDGAAA